MNIDKMVDKILTDMKDYHLPVSFAVFLVGSVLQWFHHLDMAFVAYTGTVLGAITGHAFSPAQQDKGVPDATTPTANVSSGNDAVPGSTPK